MLFPVDVSRVEDGFRAESRNVPMFWATASTPLGAIDKFAAQYSVLPKLVFPDNQSLVFDYYVDLRPAEVCD